MMNMTANETRYFDCVWIVKTSSHVLHRKTHLYVKVANFSGFGMSVTVEALLVIIKLDFSRAHGVSIKKGSDVFSARGGDIEITN